MEQSFWVIMNSAFTTSTSLAPATRHNRRKIRQRTHSAFAQSLAILIIIIMATCLVVLTRFSPVQGFSSTSFSARKGPSLASLEMATSSRQLRFFDTNTDATTVHRSNAYSNGKSINNNNNNIINKNDNGSASSTSTKPTGERAVNVVDAANGLFGRGRSTFVEPVWHGIAAMADSWTQGPLFSPWNQQQQEQQQLHQQLQLCWFASTTRLTNGNNNNSNNNNQEEEEQKNIGSSPPLSSKKSSVLKPQVPKAVPRSLPDGYGASIRLSPEERDLFRLLRQVRCETGLQTTLRVAGGWVRDKLLATPEFQTYHAAFQVGKAAKATGRSAVRLTSKFRKPASMGRQGTKIILSKRRKGANDGNVLTTEMDPDYQPVDIDVALDDMLGREFAQHLNDYLQNCGKEALSVGVVLANPEKSKHLETATLQVGDFWIDLVNLRAEEYTTEDSRIPDLMRIGTAEEDAFRRDLTINSLFYNIQTGQVEDWTGRGLDDLRKGVVATPLPPLTTLLDDPLRVLRSVRFCARLRFVMDQALVKAASDERVRTALAVKVSRERVGGEVDLMLRSPDPVGAMRLLYNLHLMDTVFGVGNHQAWRESAEQRDALFSQGLALLAAAHDHLADCQWSPPLWCQAARTYINRSTGAATSELRLMEDEETRRLLWYAAFFKPFHDEAKQQERKAKADEEGTCKEANGRRGKKSQTRSAPVASLLIQDLKRPARDAESVQKIMDAADEITHWMETGCDVSATVTLLSEIRITHEDEKDADSNGHNIVTDVSSPYVCSMNGHVVDSAAQEDPVWEHAMDFRLHCSKLMHKIGPLWRAALFLSLSEQLALLETDLEYVIEGDVVEASQTEERNGIVERYDVLATSMQQLGLVGIWDEKPPLDGEAVLKVLPSLPRGPAFRIVMDEQTRWTTLHPGARVELLEDHLRSTFPVYAEAPPDKSSPNKKRKSSSAEKETQAIHKACQ